MQKPSKKTKKRTEAEKLFCENLSNLDNCNLCRESFLAAGKSSGYGVVVGMTGTRKNGWFATLSPKTGGNPNSDFTVQLMPHLHLTHFSQVASCRGMDKNYGILFAKVSRAMSAIIMENEKNLAACPDKKEDSLAIAIYGKSTTWKEKKEHLHVKIFPFRGNIGQPYTVDSSFEKKEIFTQNGEKFVKMSPVKKNLIHKKRFNYLAKRLVLLLKKD